jgi:hypothetical protein
MDQIDQFTPQVGGGEAKFKIISLVLSVLVLVLIVAVVVLATNKGRSATTEGDVSANPLSQTGAAVKEMNEEAPSKPTVNKEASADEKRMMGMPDVENIEIVSRDESGAPISYRILRDSRFPDADGDGLSDADEERFGTDKNSPDTDGDGISDWQELGSGADPKVKDDYTTKD